MVEPFLSCSLTTNPCYTFYQRMINCVKSEELVQRMCFLEIEDWHECKSRKKHRAFQHFIHDEMHKMKIYSLPTYDFSTDTFKDGPLPKDADAYFSRPKDE
jgi:hypothetical protein